MTRAHRIDRRERRHSLRTLRGGGGVLRAGPQRRLVANGSTEGLHIYDDPVPTGMISTTILDGPDASTNQPGATNICSNCRESTNHCRSGTVLQTSCPVYAASTLGREVEDGVASIGVEITIRYQACDEAMFHSSNATLHPEVPIGPGLCRTLVRCMASPAKQ